MLCKHIEAYSGRKSLTECLCSFELHAFCRMEVVFTVPPVPQICRLSHTSLASPTSKIWWLLFECQLRFHEWSFAPWPRWIKYCLFSFPQQRTHQFINIIQTFVTLPWHSCGMKIGLRCLHTSCAVWVRQLLFWSSSFIVEALCGCGRQLFVMIGTLHFIFFPFFLVLFVVDRLLRCVWRHLALEVWRGILEY